MTDNSSHGPNLFKCQRRETHEGTVGYILATDVRTIPIQVCSAQMAPVLWKSLMTKACFDWICKNWSGWAHILNSWNHPPHVSPSSSVAETSTRRNVWLHAGTGMCVHDRLTYVCICMWCVCAWISLEIQMLSSNVHVQAQYSSDRATSNSLV